MQVVHPGVQVATVIVIIIIIIIQVNSLRFYVVFTTQNVLSCMSYIYIHMYMYCI